MSIGSSPFQGGGGASVADATETTAGKIRIATSTEAATGTNDLTAMTPLTVKERIDASLVGAVQYQGTFNATAGTPSLANAEQGDLYVIDTAGTIYGATWSIGDHLLINANMGGSIDSAKIDKVDNTNEDASESVKGVIQIATSAEATTGTNDLKAMTPLTVKERIDALNLGTASTQDVGTSADNVVQLDGSARLPAVDGSQLTNLPSASDASETTKGIIEIATNAEAQAASATDKALVPSNIGSIDVGSFNDDGTYQTADPGLASIADLTTSADKFLYTTASDTYAVASISAAGRSFVSANDAGAQRSALSLGTAATSDSGDFLASTAGLNDLADVSFTAGGGIDNYILTYDNSTTSWGAEAAPTAAAASETTAGVIEIATNAEAQAASATDKALVPSNIGSIDTGDLNDDGTYLKNLSEDSTPQLGGGLDVNGNVITSASNGLVEITPNGTGAVKLGGNTNPAELRFFDEAGTNYVALKAPADSSISADETFTLPAADGTNGQVLQTNGSGVLSFVDQSGGGGGVTYSAISDDPANAQAGYHYSCTGTFTITLATSGYSAGDEIRVKNMGTGTITIDPQTRTIDGSATDYTLDVQYSAITLVSTGTDWEII